MKLFIHSKFIVLLWLNQYLLKSLKRPVFLFPFSNRVVQDQLDHFSDCLTLDAWSSGLCVFSPQEWEIRGHGHCDSGEKTWKAFICYQCCYHGQSVLEWAVHIKVCKEDTDILKLKR